VNMNERKEEQVTVWKSLTVKATGQKNDIEQLIKVLSQHYAVLTTSRVIYDSEKAEWHQFVNLAPLEAIKSVTHDE
jgi:hypothetical protein